MVFTVSVRDTSKVWEKSVLDGSFRAPDDCLHNGAVLFELFKYVPIRLPEFARLAESEQQYVADVAAYLLRPDLLKVLCQRGGLPIGPQFFRPEQRATKYSVPINRNVKPTVHLRNNPKDLHDENWRLPDNNLMGGELFRCLHAAVHYMTHSDDFTCVKPDKYINFGRTMIAADVIAHLLDPNDLTDYAYSEAEVAAFRRTLEDELRTV